MSRRLAAVLSVAIVLTVLTTLCTLAPMRLLAEDTAKSDASQSKAVKMLGGGPDQIKLTPEEQRFTELTNSERKSRKLNELIVAPLLVKIAREKSQEMHDLNYWGHQSPVKEKRTAMRRLLYYLPEQPVSMIVGENLYYCSQVRVDEGHQALMNSPTHRANILKPEYQYIGIGTYTASDGRFWTTEIFLKIEY